MRNNSPAIIVNLVIIVQALKIASKININADHRTCFLSTNIGVFGDDVSKNK